MNFTIYFVLGNFNLFIYTQFFSLVLRIVFMCLKKFAEKSTVSALDYIFDKFCLSYSLCWFLRYNSLLACGF